MYKITLTINGYNRTFISSVNLDDADQIIELQRKAARLGNNHFSIYHYSDTLAYSQ